ncbi:Phosphatidylinositol N-acetylglucosaminyltransferase [Rhizoctonia solani]|uniref:Phosphatidylinositol N-acetylglucosaminyltransferase n=1 Tax=Rhizoctonia solani TaxID=456999 RepID=A0A8H7IBP9_9AGAM|nr:Phosphatidylinositol N-acetylglucosaminyltransferase [Rhizoctonia solani]
MAKNSLKKQPFPDNHLPASFLSSLQRNINLKQYTYVSLLKTVLPVTQHLSNTALFLSIFARLKSGLLDPRVLVCLGSGLSILGFGIHELASSESNVNKSTPYTNRLAQALKSSILVFLALASLAPVLRTLTAATSDDSIWALSATLFILHAVLADYTPERVVYLTSVLSMNAAVSASVVLASRLQTDIAVFSLMLYALQSFALLPVLRQRLQQRYTFPSLLLTCFVTGFSFAALPSRNLVFPFVIFLSLLTFGSPAVLVRSQRYKNRIRGPWDPAVPQLNSKAD